MLFRGLNIRVMETMVAMVENDFTLVNAGVDLGVKGCQVWQSVRQIESALDCKVFERLPIVMGGKNIHIIGMTEKGELFYDAATAFLSAIDGIDSDIAVKTAHRHVNGGLNA